MTCYWCTFQKRIKLSDDICKCMEWTTSSIMLAFQYNFYFRIVLGDPGPRGSKSSKVCVVWTYMSWGSYHEKQGVQCTYYLHGKTGNSGWKIKWSTSFHLGSFGKYGMWFEALRCDKFIFLPFSVCSADLDLLCSGSFTHHFKYNRFIFLHKISTQVVCVKLMMYLKSPTVSSKINQSNDFISNFILLHEKFLQFDWFRAFSLIWNT